MVSIAVISIKNEQYLSTKPVFRYIINKLLNGFKLRAVFLSLPLKK